jgi:hypothetical protein
MQRHLSPETQVLMSQACRYTLHSLMKQGYRCTHSCLKPAATRYTRVASSLVPPNR